MESWLAAVVQMDVARADPGANLARATILRRRLTSARARTPVFQDQVPGLDD